MSSSTSSATTTGGRGEREGSEQTENRHQDRGPVPEDHLEPRRPAAPLRTKTVVHHENRPVPLQAEQAGPVNVSVRTENQDGGVRWGPVWAGLLTALATFLLMELGFYALGWLTLNPGENDPRDSRALVTGTLAMLAFFLGGLVAGTTAIWRGLFGGVLHGLLVWALGVVAFIALTFFGGSALLGGFGDLTNQLGVGPQQVQEAPEVSGSEAEEVADTAEEAAAPAFWGLFLPFAASMLGGLIGSKSWPREEGSDSDTARLHD